VKSSQLHHQKLHVQSQELFSNEIKLISPEIAYPEIIPMAGYGISNNATSLILLRNNACGWL